MKAFTTLTAIAAPLIRDNIDTDAIIPSREMRSVSKTGLTDGLFAGWRYDPVGSRSPNPDFVLNAPPFAAGHILPSRASPGPGSRPAHPSSPPTEHASPPGVPPPSHPPFL